jgi:outer membrane protein OmpA-like peptidoglycan-associated protein
MLSRSSLLRVALLLPMAVGLAGCNTWWSQTPSDYPVFFSPGSAALNETAKAVIQVAADYAKQHTRQGVVVNGYTDLSGSAAANAALSSERAKAVTEQLVTDGVARARIRYNANGPSGALLSGQADRRVDITIGD